jgi:hypothetical protein
LGRRPLDGGWLIHTSDSTAADGQAAVEAGLRSPGSAWRPLGVLVRRHRADDSLNRAIARILRAELVVVDDICLVPVNPDATEDLYRRSTPPTRSAAWRSRRTCTPPALTSSCPRPWPPFSCSGRVQIR